MYCLLLLAVCYCCLHEPNGGRGQHLHLHQPDEWRWLLCAGQLNSNGRDLLIFGKQFGNVFLGVQPTFGYEGDPMRLLFSRSASPHHGFAAYYTFVEKIFAADAVLHFGTHGRSVTPSC